MERGGGGEVDIVGDVVDVVLQLHDGVAQLREGQLSLGRTWHNLGADILGWRRHCCHGHGNDAVQPRDAAAQVKKRVSVADCNVHHLGHHRLLLVLVSSFDIGMLFVQS